MGRLKKLLDNISALETKLKGLYRQLGQEKQSLCNSIIETTPNFIAIIQDKKFVFINNSGRKLLNCRSSKEILGKSIFEIVHPEKHSEINTHLNNLKAQKPNNSNLIQVRQINGKYISLEASSTPFLYNNKPAGLIAGKDITNDLLHKHKLEEEEKLRTLILDSFPELIALYSSEHKIKWMNKAAKDFYGITGDSYIGEYCYKVRFNSDTPCEDCPMLYLSPTPHIRIIHDKDIIWKV
jgi:PAS domain S-box-containing protein